MQPKIETNIPKCFECGGWHVPDDRHKKVIEPCPECDPDFLDHGGEDD